MKTLGHTTRWVSALSLATLVAACEDAAPTIAAIPAVRIAPSEQIDLLPGDASRFALGAERFVLRVPNGPSETATFGTFIVEQIGGGFRAEGIERDGHVESLTLGDVNADAQPDAIVVVRNAGSGSYVSIFGVLSSDSGYSLVTVPDPPTALLSGYQGHDRVTLEDASVVRRFPTYVDAEGLRIDRQWSIEDSAEQGVLPVKRDPDTNAAPSGPTRALTYSFVSGHWTPL